MRASPNPQRRHRFPAELISHAVWLYHVFSLSLRDVELLLSKRGVVVSYESIRRGVVRLSVKDRRLPEAGAEFTPWRQHR